MSLLELLQRQASEWGFVLTMAERENLLRYAHLLASYEKANVIGTRELDEIVIDHVLDSLSCLLFGPLFGARRLADIGSGGGLPGIPLKIARPQLRVTLIESTGKKSSFLEQACDALALEEVTVANARVEDVAQSETHRGRYDVVTSRAVARLAVVAEYSVPLLRVGGSAVCMKGRLDPAELAQGERAAEALGARISEQILVPWISEVVEKEHQLVVLQKVRETPAPYPRRPGSATKKPLGSG